VRLWGVKVLGEAAALCVAQNGVAKSATRWSTVRAGLQSDG
jgi:hypothetical protein